MPALSDIFVRESITHDCDNFCIKETHISVVYLIGNYAYKLKKAVQFPFLDHRSLSSRHEACKKELLYNKAGASQLYISVAPLYMVDGRLSFSPTGEIIDYAVKMHRFGEADLFLSALHDHPDPITLLKNLSLKVYRMHEQQKKKLELSSIDIVKKYVNDNFDTLLQLDPNLANQQILRDGQQLSKDFIAQHEHLLSEREQHGHVQPIHGDLYTANIAYYENAILCFDCIEFNEEMRYWDTVADYAFLFMDLSMHELNKHATVFLNDYLQHSGDYEGLRLLHFYIAYRAMVRAKVSFLTAMHCSDHEEKLHLNNAYQQYLTLAQQHLKPQDQRSLILLHGPTGCGKSTYAMHISTQINGIILSSDRERKRLLGVSPTQRPTESEIPIWYGEESGQQTFDRLATCAKILLECGFPVIIDATCLDYKTRERFLHLAQEWNAPFAIHSLNWDEETIKRNIQKRQQENNNCSDGTISVFEQQCAMSDPLRAEEIAHVTKVSFCKNTESAIL